MSAPKCSWCAITSIRTLSWIEQIELCGSGEARIHYVNDEACSLDLTLQLPAHMYLSAVKCPPYFEGAFQPATS